MFQGLGDIANLMKNVRDLRTKVDEMKVHLASVEIEGLGGGGLVRVKGRGDGAILSVSIDESTFAKGDRDLIEGLTAAAFNHFNQKLNETRREKLGEITGSLGLPPGLDLGL